MRKFYRESNVCASSAKTREIILILIVILKTTHTGREPLIILPALFSSSHVSVVPGSHVLAFTSVSVLFAILNLPSSILAPLLLAVSRSQTSRLGAPKLLSGGGSHALAPFTPPLNKPFTAPFLPEKY
ncbi:MAG TPA: hypothetical protein VGY98_17700 [Verrucomicrobiae bacterium]|nr:hypothetical protein [Verrucomicrobiae bacterium]